MSETSLMAVMVSKLQEEVYALKGFMRIYLSEREDIGETGEEPLRDLLREYAEKVMAETEE
jgi:hypothetical protein